MAKKAVENLLERALENENAGNNPANENKSNEEVMKKEKAIATEKKVEVAADGKQQEEMDALDAWFENLGKDESKEEQIAATEVEDCECSDDEAPKTWKAIINGKEQEIIIGFTDCNVSVSKKKEELFKLAKKEDLLPVKYNVVDAKLFWNERYLVFDHEGNEIANGTPNVYVLCPEPGTNCRFFFDEVLTDVEVHEFESV